jgi:hypothetical protein
VLWLAGHGVRCVVAGARQPTRSPLWALQKLAREGAGFMRDELSLAHYNVSPEVVLTLGLKERGGARKKQ